MLQGHRVFREPSDPNIKIWRYMDFTKFVSMLDSRSIFFSRADQLDDRFEGAVSAATVKARLAEFRTLIGRDPEAMAAHFAKTFKEQRRWMYICCWHMNEQESAAMWTLYGGADASIAVQTTYRLLADCLPADVPAGEVRYVDYSAAEIPFDNAFWPYVFKRKSFEHEREVRAIIAGHPPPNEDGEALYSAENLELGKTVPVDLNRLIERVYVAPGTPDWIVSLVRRVTAKYGLDKDVHRSDLDADPVF